MQTFMNCNMDRQSVFLIFWRHLFRMSGISLASFFFTFCIVDFQIEILYLSFIVYYMILAEQA